MTHSKLLPFLFVGALSAVAFFIGLGSRSLWNADEMRYASTVRDMHESGNWLSPQYNHRNDGEKPPLFYWIGAALSWMREGHDELCVLIPSAVSGFLSLLFTFFLARRMFGARAAYFSAVILATNVGFSWQNRIGQIDALFTALTTGSILFFFSALQEQSSTSRRWRLLAGYGFAALAWMAKGPLVLVFLAVAAFFLWLGKRLQQESSLPRVEISRLGLSWGIPLLLLLVAPWYLALGLKNPQGWALVKRLLWEQNFTRYANFWWETPDSRTVYFQFLSDFLPWTLPFLAGLWLAFRRQSWERGKRAFLAFFFLALFGFFFLSESRRAAYLIPLYPFASILVASLWTEALEGSETAIRWLRFCQAALCALMIAAAVFLTGSYFSGKTVLRVPVSEEAWVFLIPGALLIFSAALSWLLLCKKKTLLAFAASAGFLLATQAFLFSAVIPQLEPYKGRKALAERLVKNLPEGATLTCFQNERPWIVYYSPRPTVAYIEGIRALRTCFEEGQYLLIGESDFKKFEAELGAKAEIVGDALPDAKLFVIHKSK